ncbi:MAG: glycosyltransferase family 1 protein [Niabella sp.]
MNKNIILDCERMKYPYTGLYYFCKELGAALIRTNQSSNNHLAFYVPEKEKGVFGEEQKYFIQNHLHKFFPKKVSAFDIWHCTYQGTNYLPPARSKVKIVTTIHDLNFLHQGKSEGKQNKYLQKMQRLIDRSDAIVTISNFVKDQVSENLETGTKKIEVIYNGRNTPDTLSSKKPVAVNNRPFFFTIGTITDKKNFHVLAAMLLNNDYDLVIAGITQSQNYHARIVEEARSLGVESRVKLIGAVTEEEKYWLFKNCAAFCFPSLAEGFGLPVIEAMQFGTPVILSKATSLPEVGGPHAIYFEGMEKELITQAATDFLNTNIDDNTRKRLIQWSHQFDWNVAARKYWELYETIL